jgi:thymidylate synthase (methanogen type)
MIINEKLCVDAWKKALKHIIDEGSDFTDTDNRQCREVLNLIVNIEQPGKDYDKLIDMMKQFEWIYPTSEELSAIIFNKEDLAIYEYSYGPRIFNFAGKKDQINDYVIPLLRNDPNSRRAVISLFNPSTDSDIVNKNVPSLMFIHFKIKNNELTCTCFIRSNDFFIGWPGNIFQIYLLQKYVADKLNIKTGALSTMSCSAHIFHEHFEHVNKIK